VSNFLKENVENRNKKSFVAVDKIYIFLKNICAKFVASYFEYFLIVFITVV